MSISDAAPQSRLPGTSFDGLRIRHWHVMPAADEIESGGRVVKLEPLHMRLLLALAARPGQVVTTQALLDEVWRDLVVTPASVYQAVAQLRRQLGDSADEPLFIQTVHRKGYRLVAPVVFDAPVPVPAETQPAPPPEAAGAPDPAPEPDPEPDPSPLPPPAPAPTPAQPARRRAVLLTGLAAAGAVGLAAGGAWWLRGRPASAAVMRVAVLPFADASAGGAEQALARGLSQDVARALGRRTDLEVVSPDQLLGLAAPDDAAVLAQRLGVQAVLQGDLARSGARLRVSARLHTVAQAAPVWQQVFEQPAAQASELPAAVAQQVGVALSLAPWPAAAASAAATSEAYELYVLGNDAWRPKTPEAFARARQYFQRGIDADPAYARNYVGLGWTWLGQATTGAGLELPRAVALATPLFDRALRLDPDAPEALTGQATLHSFAGEEDRARALLQRALALQPSYVQAHQTLGLVEFDDGWPQRAWTHFERAAVLNPLSAVPLERLALAQLFAGRGDLARDSARAAIGREPGYPNGHWMLGLVGYATGELAQAVAGYRQALQREPRRPYLWYELARLHLDLGQPAAAAAAYARCVELLPGARWAALHAAWAWVAADPRAAAVPAALAEVPGDGSAAEWALMRLMAGLPVDVPRWQRALDGAAARGETLLPTPWFVFQGSHRLLDLATAQSLLGLRDQAASHLDTVTAQLDRLERQGNRWHTLALHRARLAALRGQPDAALAALEAAVQAGLRRAWWLRLDPAWAELRATPRFRAVLQDIDRRVAAQRAQVPAG